MHGRAEEFGGLGVVLKLGGDLSADGRDFGGEGAGGEFVEEALAEGLGVGEEIGVLLGVDEAAQGVDAVGRSREAREDFVVDDDGLPRLRELHVTLALAEQAGDVEGGVVLDGFQGVLGVLEA